MISPSEPLITRDTLMQELDSHGIKYNLLSLEMPDDTTFEAWADLGKKLCRCDYALKWWIADWLAFGEKKWGDIKRFAEMNGWADKTMYNWKRVASGVKVPDRREDLSFSHHEVIAALKPREQITWLDRAHNESISVGNLRKMVREHSGKQNANKPDGVIMNWPQQRDVQSLVEWFKRQPVGEWTPEVREWWKEFLRPLVEFYETL
jgi:hypothetical protein